VDMRGGMEHNLGKFPNRALADWVITADPGDAPAIVINPHRAERAGRADVDDLAVYPRPPRLVDKHVKPVGGPFKENPKLVQRRIARLETKHRLRPDRARRHSL